MGCWSGSSEFWHRGVLQASAILVLRCIEFRNLNFSKKMHCINQSGNLAVLLPPLYFRLSVIQFDGLLYSISPRKDKIEELFIVALMEKRCWLHLYWQHQYIIGQSWVRLVDATLRHLPKLISLFSWCVVMHTAISLPHRGWCSNQSQDLWSSQKLHIETWRPRQVNRVRRKGSLRVGRIWASVQFSWFSTVGSPNHIKFVRF